jgi:hypothetical protein
LRAALAISCPGKFASVSKGQTVRTRPMASAHGSLP